MDYNDESAVSRFRDATAQLLAGLPGPRAFQNPCEDESVLAAEFLSHLDLNRPTINLVLKQAYPYLDEIPGLKEAVHARVRFVAWKTLKGFNQIKPAYRSLSLDPGAQWLLGFREGLPCYDTFREHINERLSGCVHEQLLRELLMEQHRLLPTLGLVQVQDATPLEARRREDEAPYNPHYDVRMMKAELRWDVPHEALLSQQYYDGLASESHWLTPITQRLQDAGIHGNRLTVDGGYTSLLHIALQWRVGQILAFKPQEAWKINPAAALRSVLKRYQNHRTNPDFLVDASLDAKLRFLIDHGTEHDIDAVGRYLRDTYISTKTREENALVKSHRSQNEGLNAELKRLPTMPARRGKRELLRRSQACTLTLHLVQLTRLQRGVTTHLCRTANIQ
ncbi:MAG: hypothetical protein LC620_07930 [Halobacteriales archaeon]|nr:hypothetical protein [Halobacteriales archaeon]